MLRIEHGKVSNCKEPELFETDFIVQGDHSNIDSTRISIHVNKNCMAEPLLLDNAKVLCLVDTDSNVNLISEYVIKTVSILASFLFWTAQIIQ